MLWPIPEIPEKMALRPPDYRRWFIILLVMAIAGTLLAIFLWNATSYGQALLYGMLPAILLWLLFFGLVFLRYEQSVNSVLLWNEETVRTKEYWQRWSRKQHVVVGNVTLTPEEKGVDALLGSLADVPAYPEKARSLFADLYDITERLKFIDHEIEKQCPGYRNHLNKIVIQYQDKYPKRDIDSAVYTQWDLYPKYSYTPESFCADDENEPEGLVLLLCLQDWRNSQPEKYSEFITAQLITSDHFSGQHIFPIIAGVGRSLSSDSLTGALDMLTEYNRLESKSIRYVWLSGMGAEERTQLVQYATSKQWTLSERHPLISLDHSFGPPGPLMFPVVVSLLSHAAKQTGEIQLYIYKDEKSIYSLCLITRELFL